MPTATLTAIRNKVRKLTRSPSTNQLATADLDEYINTFIVYDFPDSLRLFSLRTNFTFYTEPYIGTYLTDTSMDADNLLYDFKNKYITVHPPFTIAGRQAFYTQSQQELLNLFPEDQSIVQVATGDGVTTMFTGTLSSIPVQRNSVDFTSVATDNSGLALSDDGAGALIDPLFGDSSGTINYITGAYSLTFATAPASGVAINAQTLPYTAARPNTILYFNDAFIVRPIPDQPYPITFEVYQRPTDLLMAGSEPELENWWQYIAYGAAKKIFEDRMDLESVRMIMPEFNKQERLILRRTIVQQTNERTATIYTEDIDGQNRYNFWNQG